MLQMNIEYVASLLVEIKKKTTIGNSEVVWTWHKNWKLYLICIN